ncbi:MAG: hypothetical protein LQ338_001600 [Usnochroma carphineum]|nr:MAG: hypothetical protein LQ338_001600 [Usnochroma carphineum]
MLIPTLLLTAVPFLLASPTPYYPRTSSNAHPSHQLSPPYCPPRPASSAQQHAIFTAFVKTLYTDKNVTDAFENYIAVDLIEHDPFDEQGRAANEAKLSHIIPFVPSTVLRQGFDNGTGFIHLRVDEDTEPQPIALADIYRMNGTCIVEHWE